MEVVVWWPHIQSGQPYVVVSRMLVGCEFVGLDNKTYKMHGTYIKININRSSPRPLQIVKITGRIQRT